MKKTYGAENIVSAVLHLDETTPHIHATMIPIVTGERKKAKTEHRTAIDKLSEQLNKIFNYFPHIKELLRRESFLKNIGLPDNMIWRLFNREMVVGTGELYSKEHSKRFKAENTSGINLKEKRGMKI